MLKIAMTEEEARGPDYLIWRGGEGAVLPVRHEGAAVLLPRGASSLAEYAVSYGDLSATRLFCSVVRSLHAPVPRAEPQSAVPLQAWFKDLLGNHETSTPVKELAKNLLQSQRDVMVLHGDLHHDNILDFGIDGWKAIDPKCLNGDRAFDYANFFCNPHARPETAVNSFEQRLQTVSSEAGFDAAYLAKWTVAWTALSALWHRRSGTSPVIADAIRQRALAFV
jgi:streptomycin 6-kinase